MSPDHEGGRVLVKPTLSGAMAGVATVLAFALIHHWMISNIWFSIVPMTLAGLCCGSSLAFTYTLLFVTPRWQFWLAYVGLHLGLLFALGAASVVIFDPIISMAEAMAAQEPPRELIVKALPLTVLFIFLGAGLVSLLWGTSPRKFGAAFLTSMLLFTLLGLNVSVLGLVDLSSEALPILARFFGLIAFIMVFYAMAFLVLERASQRRRQS
jgi:hypothetical protein